MLFFSQNLKLFAKGFTNLFGLDNEETKEEQPRNSEGDKQTDGDKLYAIMALIKDYSDFTHIDWDRTWEKNINEFLNTIAFIKEYKRREQEAIKKAQKKMKM